MEWIKKMKVEDYKHLLSKTRIFVRTRYKLLIGVGLIFFGVLQFFIFPFFSGESKIERHWEKFGVDCLDEQNLVTAQKFNFHINIISIDGVNEKIPTNIGVLPHCTAEIYTKDDSRTVYVRSPNPAKLFTLGDFFNVWGAEIYRGLQKLRVMVDGKIVDDVYGLVLKDGQRILLEHQTMPKPY